MMPETSCVIVCGPQSERKSRLQATEFTSIFDLDLIERPRRSYAEFLEQEIILPSGPFEGRLFSFSYQPYTRHVAAAIDSGLYNRFAFLGPTQSGKTLICCVGPDLWCVAELEESAICGIPNMDMASDKWQQDFLPVIKASRYAALLPSIGSGSREGAKVTSIKFKNGSILRFMAAGGKDKQRAGYTSPFLAMTEVNGYDEEGGKSKETDKVRQMEARVLSFRRKGNYRILLECTETDSQGRIHQEWQHGTASFMEPQCPHCEEYVYLDREHLMGWQEATCEKQAKDQAYFECPACKAHLDDRDRDHANRNARLVNTNDALTFSFKWNGANNLFLSAGDFAVAEWKAKFEAENKENAEKELCQFYWGRPYDALIDDLEEVIELNLADAVYVYKRGVVPEWADILTFGADVHAKLLYWSLVAWKLDGTCHVVDYGKIENPHKDHGQEEAVRLGLVDLNALAQTSWPQNNKAQPKKLSGGLVDARWLPDVVVSTVSPPLFPVQGFSAFANFKKFQRRYLKPKLTNDIVKQIGDGWHKERRKTEKGTRYVGFVVDSDDAKAFVRRRMATPKDQPGAITYFVNTEPDGHALFFRHLNAEKQVIEKGIIKWVKATDPETGQLMSENHWLDCMGYAAMAARAAGVKVVAQATQISPPKSSPKTDNAHATQPRLRSRY